MGRHIDVDLREMRRFEKDLGNFKNTAFPYATRAYVNTQAFDSRILWKQALPSKMKLRSKFTVNSILVEKTTSLDTNRQQSSVGSIADYMIDQELGDTQSKQGKHGVPIPGAAPGKRKSRGRMSKGKQLKAINLMPSVKGHRSRQIAVALAMAAKRGGPQYAFLKMKKGRQGIYLIDPSKKRLGVKKVWDLSKSSVRIPRNPTMQPSVARMTNKLDGMWRDALLYQLQRHKILGY